MPIINTGELLPSNIKQCPIFIPTKLNSTINIRQQKMMFVPTESLATEATAEATIEQNINSILNPIFETYFFKFFAGEKCLNHGYVDMPLQEIYLWDEAKFSTNIHVKHISNAIKRFKKTATLFTHSNALTTAGLIKFNTLLRPRANNYGIRKTSIKAGKPDNNPYAFYCLPHKLIKSYMDDLCQAINTQNPRAPTDTLKALMIYRQFIFIHPFRDGNGRIARLLFLHLMGRAQQPVYCWLFMLYLKNLRQSDYHQAVYFYQRGSIQALQKFYAQASHWVNQAQQQIKLIMQTYIQRIDCAGQNDAYSQIVYKQDKHNPEQPDTTLFSLFSIRDNETIYLNNPLLSCMHQVDYYLRDQFRQHNHHC